MSPEDVAARFDSRPGFDLIDYGEVGLPFYVVNAIAVVQDIKSLHPIEEFVLRSSSAGLKTLSEISGFLGLEQAVLDKMIVPMLQEDLIGVRRGSQAGGLQIEVLGNGRKALSEAGLIRPEERAIFFTYDGLTRKPKFVEMRQLLVPKELKDAGIPEIPSLPARGPEVDEVNAMEVEDVVNLSARAVKRTSRILKLRSFESRVRHYLPAVALIYRDQGTKEHRVSFAISGRLSEEHERAFASSDGIRKSQRFAALLKGGSAPSIRDVVGERIARDIPKPRATPKAGAELVTARLAVADAEREMSESTSRQAQAAAEVALSAARERLKAAEVGVRAIPVRPLPVYEHAALLRDAIQTASRRLLILSPWIRRSVVSRAMIGDLAKLLKRGVILHIGFGLGESDDDMSPRDKDAHRELEQLAKSFQKTFKLKRLGDTHAKVLIKDSEFFVISSFNWLSFHGDPNRTFREEWGTYVGIEPQVDSFYAELVTRFEAQA